jgi:tellurite resistance protein TerA
LAGEFSGSRTGGDFVTVTVMRGQKTELTRNYPGLTSVIVGIGWDAGNTGVEIDAAAFLLQGNGKCRGDGDFIFYGNPAGGSNAVTLSSSTGGSTDKARINVDFSMVPADIERVAFTLTIYEGPKRGHNFGQISGSYIRVATSGNEELIRFDMAGDYKAETAIVLAELYRHKGQWKFNPVAMGYQGGLAALCGGFGIEVSDQPAGSKGGASPASDVPKPQPESKPERPELPGPKINLQKIELTKKGQKINLEKKSNNKLGEILVNLNWNQGGQKPQGLLGSLFGGGGGSGVDLDLGCLYEMKKGDKGVIQALGNSFGSYHKYPYIALDGDDRTGAVAGGENLRINGDYIHEFKRILIFAYIYKGITNWSQADGVVTVRQPGGPDIVVRLDEHDNRKIMCAIAMIENVDNETFSIERHIRYFSGHRELDGAFGWKMRWAAGSKD